VSVDTRGSWFGVTCRWSDCVGGGGGTMLSFGFTDLDLPRRVLW